MTDSTPSHRLAPSDEAGIEPLPMLDERNIADDLTDPALGDAFDMLHEETSALGKRKLGLHEKGSDRFSIEQQASKIPTNNVIGTVQSEQSDGEPKEGGLKLLFAASLLQQKKRSAGDTAAPVQSCIPNPSENDVRT